MSSEQAYLQRLEQIIGQTVYPPPVAEDLQAAVQNLDILENMYRETVAPRMVTASQLDKTRWNILGPKLYTMCSMMPYAPFQTRVTDVMLQQRLSEIRDVYPSCQTVEDISSLCQLQSFSTDDVQDVQTNCRLTSRISARASTEAVDDLKLFAEAEHACQVRKYGCQDAELMALASRNRQLYTQVQQECQSGSATFYVALRRDGEICGSMTVKVVDSVAIIKDLTKLQERYISKLLVGSLVRDILTVDRNIHMVYLITPASSAGLFSKLGFTLFDQSLLNNLTAHMFLDVQFGRHVNIDLFRNLYHAIVQKDALSMWNMFTLVKTKLFSVWGRIAFNDTVLIRNIVALIKAADAPQLLYVLAYFTRLMPAEIEIDEDIFNTPFGQGLIQRAFKERKPRAKTDKQLSEEAQQQAYLMSLDYALPELRLPAAPVPVDQTLPALQLGAEALTADELFPQSKPLVDYYPPIPKPKVQRKRKPPQPPPQQ